MWDLLFFFHIRHVYHCSLPPPLSHTLKTTHDTNHELSCWILYLKTWTAVDLLLSKQKVLGCSGSIILQRTLHTWDVTIMLICPEFNVWGLQWPCNTDEISQNWFSLLPLPKRLCDCRFAGAGAKWLLWTNFNKDFHKMLIATSFLSQSNLLFYVILY